MENETTSPAAPPALPSSPTAAEDLQWITPPEPGPVQDQGVDTPGSSQRAKALKAIGIVTTAVVVGAVGVITLQGSSSATPAGGSANRPGGGFGGFGGPQGQQGGGGGGFTPRGGRGDRLGGTLTAVSASSISLSTFQGGTTTVKVTGSTVVTVDGSASTLSALTSGERVFVRTTGSGSSLTATQIVAGQGQGGPQGGPGGPPGQSGSGPQQQAPAAGGTGVRT